MMESIRTPAANASDLLPPFLDPDPPHWVARGLAYILIFLFAAVSVLSIVIHLPETISSPFVLMPLQGTDPVRAPREGMVAEVRVVDGQPVLKGDPMFVIQSWTIGDRSAELQTLETQLKGAEQRLANERKKYDSQSLADDAEDRRLQARLAYLTEKIAKHRTIRTIQQAKYQASLNIYTNEGESTKSEIAFKKTHLTLAQELANRHKKLYQTEFISWQEYNNYLLEVKKIALEWQKLARQLEVIRLKVNQLEAEHNQQEIDWKLTMDQLQTDSQEVRASIEKLRHESEARRAEHMEVERHLQEDMEKTNVRIAALTRDSVHSRGNELSVPSPCTGTVLHLRVKGPEAFVHDGDVLGELACSDERLQAELTVPQSGVGLIKPGQRVKLLYDAFPYQRYGVRYGTVRWVSPASVMVKDDSAFRAFTDLEDEAILVKGQPRPLMAGMRGRAEVVVSRRSLISYAFEPIHQLKESIADAPEKGER